MNVFLDTSILVEYLKGNNPDLLDFIIEHNNHCASYINHIVYSEFLFHFLGLIAHKPPISLKKSSSISLILNKHKPMDFIRNFKVLEMNTSILEMSFNYMELYNMLPNDALILACCKYHNIRFLATYDSDFNKICDREEIILFKQIEDIQNELR